MVWLAILITPAARGQNADINILRHLNVDRNKQLDGTMKVVTESVYPVSAVVPVAELAAGLYRHDRRLVNHSLQTVAALGVNYVLVFSLKSAVNRTRPYITYPYLQPYDHNKDASFPSGHTSFAFSTATSLYLAFPRWYVAVPAYAWASLAGYSRLHLGMHYPTDVLCGAIAGAGSCLITHHATRWLQHHKKPKTHAAP